MTDTPSSDSPDQNHVTPSGKLFFLAVASLGVVYGDIGTSPLYAMRECFHGSHALPVNPTTVLGVLSLIFWALVFIISIKYLVFVLRADNRGEGGILALAALVAPLAGSGHKRSWLIVTLGLFGASLLYADGMITPAISVLSAVEGLTVAAPDLLHAWVVPITIVILICLFLFQSRGTAGVGSVFGPIIFVWFVLLAAMGIASAVKEPTVFLAMNPWHAVELFQTNGMAGFVILGTVFLVVTGGEALYADVGHFGRRPIRLTWFTVVLPALLLNYFGQGALLLRDPHSAVNPFYRMAPTWALWPLIVLATAATVIASQAVITGAFSLTLQAVQLGYSPRLTVRHTSEEHPGQIYVPAVNWALMAACIALVLGFRSSASLAAAYGVAIAITMVITTILFFVLIRTKWQWSLPVALLLTGSLLAIELCFLGANLLKIAHGGWFPLVVGASVFLLMSTWKEGRHLLGQKMRERLIPLELFLADCLSEPPTRVPGTAVFMSGNPVGTPPGLRHNLAHNHVLHETVIILCVETVAYPHVSFQHRVEVEEIGEGFWRVMARYGFMDSPNVPDALVGITVPKLRKQLSESEVTYFLGRETLVPAKNPDLGPLRSSLFAWMSRNALSATSYYHLPPERVVEIGLQLEI